MHQSLVVDRINHEIDLFAQLVDQVTCFNLYRF